jgi:6-phosphogluconolactonase
VETQIVADAAAIARSVVNRIEQAAAARQRARFSLGLAGGSTPQAAYRLLRHSSLDWAGIDLWLSDERWVPWESEASNGRMALESLGEGTALHRPRWSESLGPEGSAAHYEAELRLLHDGALPDLVLLGMGADGHTASLFPNTDALVTPDDTRWYVANDVPQLDAWRLTATPWLLQHSMSVLVLVSGEDKAATLAEVVEGPDGMYPTQLLRHATGSVTFVVDEAAARGLSRS